MSDNQYYIQLCDGETHHFDEMFIPNIKSIAFALSHINRFNGHAGSYSVAQHSVLVAQQLPQEFKLSGLLHDATEAYLSDMASPLKAYLRSCGDISYKNIELFYHDVIDNHFGVDTRNDLIKQADMRMLVTEAEQLGFDKIIECSQGVVPYGIKIDRIYPEKAYNDFLNMFIELGGEL